ncbi:putative ascorbate-specific transmembrane electron transporter 1, partial [Ananas comosus]
AHALFMVTGLVICGGEAILAYKTLPGTRKVKKIFHMLLHLVALGLGGLGLFAIFKFHKDLGLKDMHSLHSWLGIGTFCLYALQWLLGFTYFLFPGSTMTMRADYAPWHIFFGVVIFLMAVCSAETGLSKIVFPGAKLGREAFLANFTGVAILLFGVAVVFGVILP